jgi:hypothetical protein
MWYVDSSPPSKEEKRMKQARVRAEDSPVVNFSIDRGGFAF